MEVKIKDRKEEVEFLRMDLNTAQIGVDYTHTDLFLRIQERLSKKKGKYTINDSVEIFHKWKTDWDRYFEDQEKASTK